MAGKIFINYRRDDSAPHALNVAQYFENKFGKSNIFIDIDRLWAGLKFKTVLEDKLAQCKVMLAIIGPNWVDARDGEGSRRLDNPEDWVRLEIERALARNIPVIPVLVAGATLPSKSDLPRSLQPLIEHQCATVTTNGFRYEMAGLARDVAYLTVRRPWGRIVAATSALILGTEDQMRAEGRIKVDAKFIQGAPSGWFKPGAGKTEWFKDHEAGPEMVVVPAGGFKMGSPEHEEGRDNGETQVPVTIAGPFAVGRFAVTFDQWNACVTDGGCNGYRPNDQGWGRGNRPVINVNWDDAKSYAAWLSRETGKTYRLLSEAEHEYVTRAGTTTPFWWGSTPKQATYNTERTVTVDSFEANPWGLFNVHGNVWEWTEDCWNDSNRGNPGDGSARTTGNCSKHVVRGGSWGLDPQNLRAAYRIRYPTDSRYFHLGFRLARALNP
jgi:formylglycine-generating enzyme required for sulfatase activity